MKKNRQIKSPRVALITNVLAHYRLPCFTALHRKMQGNIDYFVMTQNMEHRKYVMSYTSHELPVRALKSFRWNRRPYDDIHLSDIRPIIRGNYDIVILGGWSEPTFWLVWAWAGMAGIKKLIWCESTVYDMHRTGVKESVKRWFVRASDGCIVPGVRSLEYCRTLGMPESSIFKAPNATDGVYFREKAAELLQDRDRLRKAENVDGFVILFAGRLVEAFKGISTLLRACENLRNRGHRITLFLAGDGPDSVFYRQTAKDISIDVRFLGTIAHDTLCRYYAMADVFVLPSRSEPWGFVLNEGMEFGLPLVVSNAVGAGPDLVDSGKNGYVFFQGNADALSYHLDFLIRHPDVRKKMAENSRRIIRGYSPENWAEGLYNAIQKIAG